MAPTLHDIPDALFHAAQKDNFLEWLLEQPIDKYTRCRLASLWSGNTGVQLNKQNWAHILGDTLDTNDTTDNSPQ